MGWIILAVALAARLAAVLATPGFEPVLDPADYERHARSIAEGAGFPDALYAPAGGPSALRPPTYPYFLGAVYAAAGPLGIDELWGARVVQALVGTLTVALVGLVGRQLFSRRIGHVAMAIAAVFPPLVLTTTSLLSETLFVPLVLGSVAAVLRLRAGASASRWAVVAGVLAGLAVLTRSNGAVILPALAVGAWNVPGVSWRSLRAPLVVLATAAVTVLPWSVRNFVVLDEPVLVSTQAGYALSGVYNDASRDTDTHRGAFRPPAADPRLRPILARDLDEVELERELRGAARDYAIDHPSYVLEVAGLNAARMLHLNDLSYPGLNARDVGLPEWLANAGVPALWLVGLLSIVGALAQPARAAPRWIWAVPLLLMSVVFVGGFIRYRAPVDPFLILLAAIGASTLRERWRARGNADTGSPATAAAPR